MYISKSRFINWTRCPMYFAMDLKHNPLEISDIEIERERREEVFSELLDGTKASEGAEDEDEYDAKPSEEQLFPLVFRQTVCIIHHLHNII